MGYKMYDPKMDIDYKEVKFLKNAIISSFRDANLDGLRISVCFKFTYLKFGDLILSYLQFWVLIFGSRRSCIEIVLIKSKNFNHPQEQFDPK